MTREVGGDDGIGDDENDDVEGDVDASALSLSRADPSNAAPTVSSCCSRTEDTIGGVRGAAGAPSVVTIVARREK